MRSSRAPQVLSCGLVVLLVAGCTTDADPEEPPAPEPTGEPTPLPTAFDGAAPPGVDGEVLRFLHGEEADVPDILDDPLGVRISPVGTAFLISSGGADRHLLHDAATGDTLWEGEARFRGFDTDQAGAPVMRMTDDDGPYVLDARGERVWEPAEEGDAYLDGVAVRYPDEWSFDDPGGEYAVLDVDGATLWEYAFDAPAPEDVEPSAEPDEEATGEPDGDAADGGDRADEDVPVAGVPVTAWDGGVLVAPGGPVLRAASLDEDSPGEELWSISGVDEDLGRSASAPAPVPSVLGRYTLPGESDEGAEGGESGGDVLIVRWAGREEPSTLAAYDREDGALLWALEEPGPNPVGEPFDPAEGAGSLYDDATGTLLLPQASGEATLVAVDLARGEVLWGLEEDDVSIAPAFTHDGLVYADSRSSDGGGEQLVLEADTMDVVAEDPPAYVEAVNESGHAILVWDRQRFVYGPPPDEEPSSEPTEDPSPTDDPS
ncbi:PQQ-like beta-propeller repeat protein [Nocardiopsis sp. EMB25]|uniref:outer membrane protein assembly factor BamB family protein n=1 Tax=Nocardiopsis sp. EMB25 TaxID=2835867 RepID=UPI002283DE3B|nr:PQQ-binding-like beta-propeller repeat protein [Nocardiopsis sp. EMB25]MCY9786247.1 PQQ-like beta-propeller repeat protein [Nocardiopsis sp. EMB25]